MIILKQVIHDTKTNSVEATWVDDEGAQVKCHSYADVQMDMLRDDLGADAAQYADLIALVEAGIKPPEPAPVVNVTSVLMASARKMLIDEGMDDAAVRQILGAITDPRERAHALVDWEFAPSVHISNPLVQYIAQIKGWTPEFLQGLFNNA